MMQHIKNLLAPKTLLLAALCYTVIITIALLSPTNDIPKISFKYADKVVHFGIHYLLMLLWLGYFYFRNDQELTASKIVKTALAVFLYGIIIELLQSFMTTGRTGEAFDVIANSVGLFAGFITFRIFQKKIL